MNKIIYTRYTFADGFTYSAIDILGGATLDAETLQIMERKHTRAIVAETFALNLETNTIKLINYIVF